MIPQQHYEQLISRLEEFMLLSTHFKIFLKPLLTLTYAKAGTFLANANQVQYMLSYIISGRAEEHGPLKYYPRKKHPESQLTWFWISGDLVFSSPGFFSHHPAKHDVVIREDSTLIQLRYEDFVVLKANFSETQELSELIREHYSGLVSERIDDMSQLTNKQRYLKFKKRYKQILYSTSMYKLADYLGMSYKTFYRLHKG